jgi:hypothetical protein
MDEYRARQILEEAYANLEPPRASNPEIQKYIDEIQIPSQRYTPPKRVKLQGPQRSDVPAQQEQEYDWSGWERWLDVRMTERQKI